MNKENLEKIVTDLDNLKNLVDFFSTQEEIPSIEIDIVKRKLQDIYMLFSEEAYNSPGNQNKINQTTPLEMDVNVEPKIPMEEPVFELDKENKKEKNTEQSTSENKEKDEVQKPKTSKTNTTLSDKLKGNNVSLNERLSNKKGSDLSSRLKKGPIKDLNEAIGLNDKFSYIKSLFGGDAHKFRKTIDRLNGIQNLSEAETYISSNFDWDMDDSITHQFLDLVHRKLQSNG